MRVALNTTLQNNTVKIIEKVYMEVQVNVSLAEDVVVLFPNRLERKLKIIISCGILDINEPLLEIG